MLEPERTDLPQITHILGNLCPPIEFKVVYQNMRIIARIF